MNLFIEKAKEFEQQCKKYLELHREQVQQKTQQTKIVEKNTLDFFLINKPMTIIELHDYGTTLASEYSSISKEKINKLPGDGVPTALSDKVRKIHFDLDLDLSFYKNHNTNKEQKDPNEEIMKDQEINNEINNEIILKQSPSENCQKIYYLCLEKIQNLGIDIYGIKKDLSRYKNNLVSSIIGGTNPFIFYCKKNNYKFEIRYDDDCDCKPGILSIHSIVDCNDETTIKTQCDLFCQCKSKLVLNNFLMLLSCKNINEFMEKRYSHFIEMAESLKEKYTVDCSTKFIEQNSININDNDFNLIIKITDSDKNECVLIPYADSSMKDYLLYLCPTLDDINTTNKKKKETDCCHHFYERKNIDWNTFNHDMYPRFSFIYKSSDDLSELIKCIDYFLKYKSGKYGYCESKSTALNSSELVSDNELIYYNETFINDTLTHNKYPDEGHIVAKLYSKSNNYYGPEMDIILTYHRKNPYTPCLKNYLKGITYPYDNYLVRFLYDKKIDTENCIFSIRGQWHDVTPIVEFFYQNNFDITSIDNNTTEIAEKFEFKGKFSQCYELLLQFHNALVNNQATEESENGDFDDEQYVSSN